ncbi:hypothetical protein MINTM018_34750 [Mycobacterium intracellulare]|uniref:Uncharacterized protein n=1 Tax=Mycobacterium intracellulare TaxID=1767 RepID=A0A7R7MVC3_MYCIT|nr:hypothetical protein MINTM018_34750 [Mycobacterium intracellulare]
MEIFGGFGLLGVPPAGNVWHLGFFQASGVMPSYPECRRQAELTVRYANVYRRADTPIGISGDYDHAGA